MAAKQGAEGSKIAIDRNYLTPTEIDYMLEAARRTPGNGRRDFALILIMFRHGLRCAEAASLPWHRVDLEEGRLQVRRLKGRKGSTDREWVHPLRGPELRALRPLWRARKTPYVFEGKQGPLATRTIYHIIQTTGERAGYTGIHPHQLRHACGYALANAGHDTRTIQEWLGHANIKHTAHYTQLAADRFEKLWPD
ncbi:MAG: tyrosine-type recombinase/integrase [Gammaproteobacteria bacterium]|nr:tyrosine-type recombinase/integrase [Gammaproteobacteria bacterium]